ncbi:MAG: hypothetical protein M3R36_01110 [Bacteroidota bacterium]|nr:hypothetical protein [Bacteroidota bacterium]
MERFLKDVLIVSSLASCIAADNFKSFEYELKKLRLNAIEKKIYETILQSYLFCGFPAALESLKIFKKYFPEFYNPNSQYDVSKFRKIGQTNCKLIYKKNYKKLIDNINSLSPDLTQWMLIEGYGKVLGRDGLGLLEREFVNVSILCTRYYEHQLYSHIKGCINLGACKENVKDVFIKIKNTAGARNTNKGLKLLDQIIL